MARFGDVYRWCGPEGAGQIAMMVNPKTRMGLWGGIHLNDSEYSAPGEMTESFTPKFGKNAHHWEPIECTETAEPTSGKGSSSSTASR